MRLSHSQWWRLIAGTAFFAVADALWTLLTFGKTELLSWHGIVNVVITSVLFFLMMMWLITPKHSDNDKDEK